MQRILFVCTGNICRSPTAEGIFRARIAAAGLADRFDADSAGTHGYHVGGPPSGPAIRIAAAAGVDLSRLRARRLEPRDFERFDLLLGMDDGHGAILRAQAPKHARGRVGLLLDYAPGLGLREVADPYYGNDADYRCAFATIAAGVDGLVAQLRQNTPNA